MSGDGKPEESIKRLGNEIARQRTIKGLTRPQLIVRVLYKLEPDHPFIGTISEGWLARLESGRTVKVSHQVINIICDALECTDGERVAVLMAADRNPLANSEGLTTPEAEVLGRIMAHIYRNQDVRTMLKTLRGNRRAETLTMDEIDEIAKTIITVMTSKRSVKSVPPSTLQF